MPYGTNPPGEYNKLPPPPSPMKSPLPPTPLDTMSGNIPPYNPNDPVCVILMRMYFIVYDAAKKAQEDPTEEKIARSKELYNAIQTIRECFPSEAASYSREFGLTEPLGREAWEEKVHPEGTVEETNTP